MHILIAGGTGFIGQYLVNQALLRNERVTVLGRDLNKITALWNKRVEALTWPDIQNQPNHWLASIDLIINLCGENISQRRWTNKQRQLIIDSRILPTQQLVELCLSSKHAPPLFNASAVGIYGASTATIDNATIYDETSPINDKNPPDFSTKVTTLWEKATAPLLNAGRRVVNLRFGVVLGPHGGALTKIVLPFKCMLGGNIGSGQQPFSWVSIVDLDRAIRFIYEKHDIQGPVNIVAPHIINQHQLAEAIGTVLKKPYAITMPAFILKSIYGQMANELLLHGQCVKPISLLSHGFRFTYDNIRQALRYALEVTSN